MRCGFRDSRAWYFSDVYIQINICKCLMISTMFTNMLKLTVPAPLTLSHKNTLNITFWIFSLANAPSGRVTRTGVKSKTAAQLVLKHDNINTRNKIPNRASAFPLEEEILSTSNLCCSFHVCLCIPDVIFISWIVWIVCFRTLRTPKMIWFHLLTASFSSFFFSLLCRDSWDSKFVI